MKRFSLIIGTLITSIAIAAIFIVRIVHAQSAQIDISISSVPVNPLPLQQTTISLQSYSADISQANITWTYNSKTIDGGKGLTTITVTAPASGVTGTITAVVTGGSFETSAATLILRPASVDMLWEGADSYTPPFYKGLPLPSVGGIIRVMAVPSISAPKSMSYSWTQNGDALQRASGYGKNTILFQNDGLNSSEQIAVTEKNGSFTGNADITITPGDPVVAGYFNNDGFIDYSNGSTSTLSTYSTGVLVHFEPYYFSAPISLSHDLAFSYKDDAGTVLTPASVKNELPLSRPDNGGQSNFKTAVSTIVFNLQNITKRFTVNFN
ncbi:MAG: hypothetical protein ABIO57_00830 [Candidatus Paceibacterota bacterium]